MDPVLHGEDDSEEEEESYGGLQQCRRRKGAIIMEEQEMQRVKAKKRGKEVMARVNGGGRIVRATGRKDRHSKVCTARGTRDRRVRLSPNTAIQFYDVQDRLGYDRPSKAIDWLMKEAKAEIEALNNQPAGLKEELEEEEEQQQEEARLNGEYCGILEKSNPSFSVFPMENNNNNNASDLHTNCVSSFFFDDQRLISWNLGPEEGSFTTPLPVNVIAQNQVVFSQREPLQSSFFPHHTFSYAAAAMGGFADNNELSAGMSTAAAEEHHHLTSGRPTTSLLD